MDTPEKGIHGLHAWFRTAVLQAFIIVAAGLLCAVLLNILNPGSLQWAGRGTGEARSKAAGISTVSITEAFTGYEQGSMVFIDARDMADFRAGHVPGAINIPAENPGGYPALLTPLARSGRTIVVYCSAPGCPMSEQLADKLIASGLVKVKILPEGWAGWVDAGFPIEEGPKI